MAVLLTLEFCHFWRFIYQKSPGVCNRTRISYIHYLIGESRQTYSSCFPANWETRFASVIVMYLSDLSVCWLSVYWQKWQTRGSDFFSSWSDWQCNHSLAFPVSVRLGGEVLGQWWQGGHELGLDNTVLDIYIYFVIIEAKEGLGCVTENGVFTDILLTSCHYSKLWHILRTALWIP